MNNLKKKFKHSDFNFLDRLDSEPHVETNILINEEAKYLNSINNFDDFESSKYFDLSSEKIDVALKKINKMKKSLYALKCFNNSKNQNLNSYNSYQNSMNEAILQLDEVINVLKSDDEHKKNLGINNYENKILNYYNIDQDNFSGYGSNLIIKNKIENDLFKAFRDITEIKLKEINEQIAFLTTDLTSSKSKFDEIINKYDSVLKNVFSRQDQLNSNTLVNHNIFNNFLKQLDLSKKSYVDLKQKVDKINDSWVENNKILQNLEEFFNIFSDVFLNNNDDLFLEFKNIKNNFEISSEKISNLYSEVDCIKNYFKNEFSSFENRIIEQINKNNFNDFKKNSEKISNLYSEIDNIKNYFKNEFSSFENRINNQLNKNNFEINEIKKELSLAKINTNNIDSKLDFFNDKKDLSSFSISSDSDASFIIDKISLLDSAIERNRLEIQKINNNFFGINDLDNFIDNILSSPIFQKSLELKITNMTIENNNYIGDEFKSKIENFSSNIILDINDIKKNNNDLISSCQMLEIRTNEIINQINSIDQTAELKAQLEFLENNFKQLYEETSKKIRDNLSILNLQLETLSVDETEVVKLINSSHELTTIIKDKTRQVIEDKLEFIKLNLVELEKDFEKKLFEYSNSFIDSKLNDFVNFRSEKIKDETLELIYKELDKRDKLINLNNKELSKNYESIIEFNRVLNSLEDLILKQYEQSSSYIFDKHDSLLDLTNKIIEQKSKISIIEKYLFNKIDLNNDLSISIIHNSSRFSNELKSWKLEFLTEIVELVKSLVKDEIKKKNLVSYLNNKSENSIDSDSIFAPNWSIDNAKTDNSFFVNRVKDILERLENSELNNAFVKGLDENIFEYINVKDDNITSMFETKSKNNSDIDDILDNFKINIDSSKENKNSKTDIISKTNLNTKNSLDVYEYNAFVSKKIKK